MHDDDQTFFESVVHALRNRGWSKLDAEAEALDRLERARELDRRK